ncbi:MAG: BNR repeat-containing protein [Polyangiaceae bacterium]
MKHEFVSLSVLLSVAIPSVATAQSITLVRDTVLSSNATAVKSYDTNVNIASYRHQGILYYSNYQFAAWYNGNTRNVIVARRTFNSSTLAVGTWQWAYVNFNLASGADSHNVISLGISTGDGRLHVAIGQHDTQLYSIRSNANAATGSTWDNTVFGGTASAPAYPIAGLPGYGAATNNVTYPYFMNAADSAKTLQFVYRTGSSGNGQLQLAEYNASTGAFSALGKFVDSAGTYTQNGVSSTTRNAYPHGFNYDYAGRLHMAFTWRENLSTQFIANCSATINNHDTMYVYSDDRGRTWKNSAGTTVGTTGSNWIQLSDTAIVVDTLPVGRDLMNQETQIMDRNNLFHALISYVPGRYQSTCATDRTQAQPFHLWRSASGVWTKVEVKLNGADVNQGYDRSKLFFGLSNNLYAILPDMRIIGASASTNWTDWKLIYDGRSLGNYGETIIDYNLTRVANGVSVVYLKNTSNTTGELHVADFKTTG